MRKALLLMLLTSISSLLYAQQQEPKQERFMLPNWDSLDNLQLGKEYVPFSITTLDGKTITNTTIQGKVVFFVFWNKHCVPCLKEFDELNELYSHFTNDNNVVIAAVTYDQKEDIQDILDKYQVKFPVATVATSKEIREMSNGRGYPSIVLLDTQGRIRKTGHFTLTDINGDRHLTPDSTAGLINSYKSK